MQLTTKQDIKQWFSYYNHARPSNYHIDDDLCLIVPGDVDIYTTLVDGILPVRFKYVSGNFNCDNMSLKTLEGVPEEVGGNFDCSNNNLVSLFGAPKKVGGDFICSNNILSTFEYCPQFIGNSIYCENNIVEMPLYLPAVSGLVISDFSEDEIAHEQEIMRQSENYQKGIENYKNFSNLFGI